jgi:WD40 repeat protein
VGIWALAFDPVGGVLASGDDDGTITLWRVGKRPVAIPAHEGAVKSLAFAPVGGMLASGGIDGTLRLWDRREGKALGDPIKLDGPVEAVGFSPDGRWLLALHSGRLTVWDTTLWQSGTKTFARVRSQFCASLWSQIPAAGAAACDLNG